MIFDRVACISLDKRVNERERLQKEFGGLSSKGTVELFVVGDGKILSKEEYSRINTEPPAEDCRYFNWRGKYRNSYNAMESYREIFRQAKKDGVATILTLEDDATKLDNYEEIMKLVEKQLLMLPPWDILYLGANHTFSDTIELSPNVLKISGSLCWHALVFKNRTFDDIINISCNVGPIDLAATHFLTNRFNCYSVWPNLVVQKPGWSFCENSHQDYSHYWLNKGKNW